MEHLRVPCCGHQVAPGQAWLGHVLGLNIFTLRYPKPGEEAGYLMHCTDRLCSTWQKILVLYILVYSYWLMFLMDVPDDKADPAYAVNLFTFFTRVACVALALVSLIVFSWPRLRHSIRSATREKAVLLLLLYTQVTIFDKYYVAKLYGHADPVVLFPDLEGYSDSFVLMNCFMFLLVSHVCLPIRWFLLVSAEVMVVAMYASIVFVLGSPDPKGNIIFIHFIVLVVLIAMGKRQSEVNERLVFSSFLAEKGLRMHAEFQLSRAAPPSKVACEAASDDGQASYTPTTATAEAFRGSDLESIWEIGWHEQWLIDEQELSVNPHLCLGSGGFGLVLAGEFCGSPVALKLHIKTGTVRPLQDIGNELRLLRKLRHPNIVLFHGACLSVRHNDLVLVMERVVGESMAQFVARQPAAAKCWSALLGVCHALAYLHSRNPPISHGDLKPGNVIVERCSSGVRAKLLDFGLARLITRTAKPGGGTYRWMAPGALTAKSVRLGDDVFAFGLMVYYVATGRKPFIGWSDSSLKAVAAGASSACPSLEWSSAETTEFVGRCKSLTDPCVRQVCEDRPSIGEVHDILRGFRENVLEEAPEPPQRLSKGQEEGETGLWPKLQLARHIVAHKETKPKRRLLPLPRMKPRSEPAALDEPPNHLAPLPEEEEATQDDPRPAALAHRHPELHPTPTHTIIGSLFDLMLSWNSTIAPNSCCEFHASVRVLSSMCTMLAESECAQLSMAGMHIYQCPSCQILIPDDEGGLRRLDCQGCGYAGPPGLHVVS